MEGRQELVFASLKHSRITLGTELFAIPELAELRARLDKVCAEIDKLALDQRGPRRHPDCANLPKAREDIRKHLLMIAEQAEVALDGLPGLKEDFRVPHRNANNRILLDATQRIIRNSRPHLASLFEVGLPRNTIDVLETLSREVAAMDARPNTEIARASRATLAIPGALRRGRKIIDALDRTIKVLFADDRVTLNTWAGAKRIPKKPGRPRKPRPKNPPDE
jgi:hypothetical protein